MLVLFIEKKKVEFMKETTKRKFKKKEREKKSLSCCMIGMPRVRYAVDEKDDEEEDPSRD